MQRLRDMRTVPGSVEGILVELIKACRPLEASPITQRRVYAQVLDVAFGRRRKVLKRSRVRPRIGLSLLLLAGVAAASTVGAHWIERVSVAIDDPPVRVNPEQPHKLLHALLKE